MSDYRQYRRSAIAEMVDWHEGFDMTDVSISEADSKAGSPRSGDKIARNPANHEDRWLVAAAYFAENFEAFNQDSAWTYDSTADTLNHSQRVGELMAQAIVELVDRAMRHDRSKTEDPELEIFNEFTPKLAKTTYGSDEYLGYLEAMGEGLAHHYAHNRHHPEHFLDGINDMTLLDLIEMLADWKAATECI
jgi:hypothetical protein